MNKNIVLFVDDEISILHSIQRAVLDENFEALFANNVPEALDILTNNDVSLLVTDIYMPGIDGLSLLKEIKIQYPDIIRIVLSGKDVLSIEHVLSAINHGDIFRFITKPWKMEEDLFAVIYQGIDYYNLRRDKKKLEISLQVRNTVYKNMLQTMDEKLLIKPTCAIQWQTFFITILDDLLHELSDETNHLNTKRILTKIRMVREIMNDHVNALPPVIDEFILTDIALFLKEYITKNYSQVNYQEKIAVPDIKCSGKLNLLFMILVAIAKLVCHSGTNRTFKYLLSSQLYEHKGMIQISNVIEFGYVDGGSVLIDGDELLTYDNLSYYIALLAHIGLPYEFVITYTYISQNTSLISVRADFMLV